MNAKSERRHRADRDPKEEQRAGRPREVIPEHGEIGQRVARPALLGTPPIAAASKTINPTMTSNRCLSSAGRPLVHASFAGVSTL